MIFNPPKIGTEIAETKRTKLKINIIGDCLSYFLTRKLSKTNPIIVPIKHHKLIHRAYQTSSIFYIRKINVVAPVENIIKYIPVAEETYAGTPILIKTGLKIAPPPSPKAPDIQPPSKASKISLNKSFP